IAMQLLSWRVKPGQAIPALSADAAHVLLTCRWSGNARELDNVLQRALILCTGPVIGPAHLVLEALNGRDVAEPAGEAGGAIGAAACGALARSLEATERELLLEALRDPQSTRRIVAERLGISPRTLRYKLARLRAAGVSVPAA
ncbi:MAG: winged helix-turn-helix transcriptional regulator, partial [Gammaproteobacteria bacterium]|nr:winged helix-turn-helix transcriptional regulator [Gammaproteobacteria bacterium]